MRVLVARSPLTLPSPLEGRGMPDPLAPGGGEGAVRAEPLASSGEARAEIVRAEPLASSGEARAEIVRAEPLASSGEARAEIVRGSMPSRKADRGRWPIA